MIARRALRLRPATRALGTDRGSDEQTLFRSERRAYFAGLSGLSLTTLGVFGPDFILPPPEIQPEGFMASLMTHPQWKVVGLGFGGLIAYGAKRYRDSYVRELVKRGRSVEVWTHSWTGAPQLAKTWRVQELEAERKQEGLVHVRGRGEDRWMLLSDEGEWLDAAAGAAMLGVSVGGAVAPSSGVAAAAPSKGPGTVPRRARGGRRRRKEPTKRARSSMV